MKTNKRRVVMGILTIFVILGAITLAKTGYYRPDNNVIAKKDMQNYLGEDRETIVKETNLADDASKEEVDEIEEENKISAISTSSSNVKKVSDTKKNIVKEQKTENESSNAISDYKVASGDSLFLISQKTNVSVNDLKTFNNLDSDMIHVGQSLKLAGNSNSKSEVTKTPSPSRGDNPRDEDLYWLSRIIHAEAQGESYQGKVAVGNVVLNRVNSSEYPNTIYGVVFDKKDGYTQFSPVIDGSIYNTPDNDSINAAREALNGAKPVGNALYFLNPAKSTNFWITANRKSMMSIGKHDFYY